MVFSIIFQDGLTPVVLALLADKEDLATVLIEGGTDVNTPAKDVRKSFIALSRSMILIVCGSQQNDSPVDYIKLIMYRFYAIVL